MSTNNELMVELATGSAAEQEAEARLRAVLGRWPLDRFIYLDRVLISAEAPRSGGVHAPLLATGDLLDGVEQALVAFIHAQMHVALWEMEGVDAAKLDAKRTFRDVDAQPDVVLPCLVGDVATHVAVAVLEREALSELVGADRAIELLRGRPGRLFRDRVLSDAALDEFAARHSMRLPSVPHSHERRGTVMALGRGGPHATLATGKQLEVDLADRLTALHDELQLEAWRFSERVVIDTRRPNLVDEAEPVLSTYFVRAADGDLLMNYAQVQAGWWSRRVATAALEPVLGSVVDRYGFHPDFPRGRALQVVFAVAISLEAAVTLLPADAVTAAIERHPRNRDLLELLRPTIGELVASLRRGGVAVTATGGSAERSPQ